MEKHEQESAFTYPAPSEYGFHRVLVPRGKGSLIQAAVTVENVPRILNDYEVLIDVEHLHLDSTSMKQIHEAAKGDFKVMKDRIFSIIEARGKMHNPATNSGGVLVGKVKEIGKGWTSGKLPTNLRPFTLKVGDTIIPVASLSCIPLDLDEIYSISGETVAVKGTAVLSGVLFYTSPPPGMNTLMALSALDVSRAVPLVEKCMKRVEAARAESKISKEQEPITVFVVGCGKAGVTCISLLKTRYPYAKVLAVDVSDKTLDDAKQFIDPIKGDVVAKVDAQNVLDVLEFINTHTGGKGADLVLSCVNVRDVESSSLIATRNGGITMFFSMATQFDKACLGTDGIAKDVDVMIGAGVTENQVPNMFRLLEEDPKLYQYFKREGEAATSNTSSKGSNQQHYPPKKSAL